VGIFEKFEEKAKEKLRVNAVEKLRKARQLSAVEKINFLSEAILWLALKDPYSIQAWDSNYTIGDLKYLNTNVKNESIIALYLFERGLAFQQLYHQQIGNKREIAPYSHLDFNFSLHYAVSNELIGLISCARREQPLDKNSLNIEYHIAKEMLGKNNVDFIRCWANFQPSERGKILPNYYFVMDSDPNTLITLPVPVEDYEDIKSIREYYRSSHPIMESLLSLRIQGMNQYANYIEDKFAYHPMYQILT
jgi:hypothetical protein